MALTAGLVSGQGQPAAAQTGADQSREAPAQPPSGAIRGTAADTSGSVVVGAVVTLEAAGSTAPRTTVTDDTGSFHFSTVEPGNYKITIAAAGFAVWTAASVTAGSGENPPLSAVLQVAPESTKMDVGLSEHERAVEQVKAEEKQRLLGIFPNFFVSYEPNPAPLTAAQKFQLGWKSIFDPVPILFAGIGAGIEQARNSYNQFGQGTEGYAKRFGAILADRVDGIFIGHVLTQSVFHQDPRYFYKSTSGFGSRVLYAIGTAFVAKGDNGHWQPDYSDVLGGLAAGEISTLYYPASSRTGLRLFHNVLLGFSGRASAHLLQQFIYRKVTTHVPRAATVPAGPVLREGTPVSLISVEDLSGKTAANAGPIAFVLARDLQVDGVTVAPAGCKASGQVTYSSAPGEGQAMHVGIERVRLQVGKAEIPLRNTQVRGGSGGLEYHRVEDTGRIAMVLYVSQNMTLPAAH